MTFVLKKMETKTEIKGGPTRRKSTTKCEKLCAKEERNASLKKVSIILQKPEEERTLEEQQVLNDYSELVSDLKSRWQRRDELKKRMEEWEESTDVLQEKALALAQAIAQSEHLVIYTGAGISTAARIPDYRGKNGIWTRLQQGKDIGNHDLSLAEPTYTHMALSELYSKNILKYIVSQNCDGLHLRSGLPRTAVSELHGNMYIEVCKNCKPVREYWRLFDVTENTARYSHKTMRRCYKCSKELTDTIVHFGERGTLQWPLNWKGACTNADKADTIICLGSSLKVLKRYPWLWQMSKPAKKRPNLFIVNLQWTPKDDHALLKINGKCDVIMKMVMKHLGVEVPQYERENDPIFAHATMLLEEEMHTTNQPFLKENLIDNECENVINNKSSIDIKSEVKSQEIDSVHNESNKSLKLESNCIETKEDSKEKSYCDQDKITESDTKFNEKTSVKDKSRYDTYIQNQTSIKAENFKEELSDNTILNLGEKVEAVRNNTYIENQTKVKVENFKKEFSNETNFNHDNSGKASISHKVQSAEVCNEKTVFITDQTEAIDYSKQKSSANTLSNICDKNTHSSIKVSRLTLNGSRNCTVNETLTVAKRKTQTNPPANNFSIDNILNRTPQNIYNEQSRPVINPVENFQALMAYYELANTVLQNQMLGYVTSNVYPSQTSFLYPGFHSIINPMPFLSYDFNSVIPNLQPNINKIELEIKKEPEIPKEPSCKFCFEHFKAYNCLYYTSVEPKFVKELFRFSKVKNCNTLLVCICCDYTTEEEDSSGEESKNKKASIKLQNDNDDTDSIKENENKEVLSDVDESSSENIDKKTDNKSKVQAGWFGKGYRKNRYKKVIKKR